MPKGRKYILEVLWPYNVFFFSWFETDVCWYDTYIPKQIHNSYTKLSLRFYTIQQDDKLHQTKLNQDEEQLILHPLKVSFQVCNSQPLKLSWIVGLFLWSSERDSALNYHESLFVFIISVQENNLTHFFSSPPAHTLGVGGEVVPTLAHDASLHFCRARYLGNSRAGRWAEVGFCRGCCRETVTFEILLFASLSSWKSRGFSERLGQRDGDIFMFFFFFSPAFEGGISSHSSGVRNLLAHGGLSFSWRSHAPTEPGCLPYGAGHAWIRAVYCGSFCWNWVTKSVFIRSGAICPPELDLPLKHPL